MPGPKGNGEFCFPETLIVPRQNTIPDKSLGTLAHFSVSVRQIYQFAPLPPNSMLFIVINSALLDSNIVRGKGALYSNDVIDSVSNIAC